MTIVDKLVIPKLYDIKPKIHMYVQAMSTAGPLYFKIIYLIEQNHGSYSRVRLSQDTTNNSCVPMIVCCYVYVIYLYVR
jgi:hypothetical protein